MMGRGRGRGRGRGKPQRSGASRYTLRPSRYLWVGNLGPDVTERFLAELFVRFGEVESVSHVPGRCYAFVNFVQEEAAVEALRELQGRDAGGQPMRIEFTRGDRAPISSSDDRLSTSNRGSYSTEHGESLLGIDSRSQYPNAEILYDKPRRNKSSEPSEILWIGFPSFLSVDEASLRRAFSPFGEIEKITAFSGRNYAFVQYRSVVAACRAKEALQGKLFNDPRISVCFSRTDTATTEHGRNSAGTSLPAPLQSNFHSGPSEGVEPFRRGRNFDRPSGEFDMASPSSLPHKVSSRNSSLQTDAGPGASIPSSFKNFRHQSVGLERRIAENAYEHYGSIPEIERRGLRHDDISLKRSWKTQLEDSWEVEDGFFPLAKKPNTGSLSDKELPEYPLFGAQKEYQGNRLLNINPSFPRHHHGSIASCKQGVSECPRKLICPYPESDDPWKTSDGFKPGHGLSPMHPVKLERINPEPHQPSLKEEWKWEGTIGKSDKPVCRARCFPVGEALGFMLPEFLNCTARTDLNILSEHYYQAASSWVVFFVPETDADIALYNEFMHYLGEKQRAAAAKLDENITLFLVPPSEFSEKVLKVPGNMSISGVILQFKQHSSNFCSVQHSLESVESKHPFGINGSTDGVTFREDTSFQRRSSPNLKSVRQGQNYFSSSLGLVAPVTSSFPAPSRLSDNLFYLGHIPPVGKAPDFNGETRQDQLPCQGPVTSSNWSNNMHPNSQDVSFPPPAPIAASQSYHNSTMEEFLSFSSEVPHGITSISFGPETWGVPSPARVKPQISSPFPVHLEPEQLVQLTALLGQQKQLGKETRLSTNESQPSVSENHSLPLQVSIPTVSVVRQISQMQQFQHSSTAVASPFSHHQQPQQSASPFSHHQQPQQSASPFSHHQQPQPSSSISAIQVSQGKHMSQLASSVCAVQPIGSSGQQSNLEASSSTRGETEADSQKRLQATLQLAAALLQQIQQQSNTTDHQ